MFTLTTGLTTVFFKKSVSMILVQCSHIVLSPHCLTMEVNQLYRIKRRVAMEMEKYKVTLQSLHFCFVLQFIMYNIDMGMKGTSCLFYLKLVPS